MSFWCLYINFEQISFIFLAFSLLTLNKEIPVAKHKPREIKQFSVVINKDLNSFSEKNAKIGGFFTVNSEQISFYYPVNQFKHLLLSW